GSARRDARRAAGEDEDRPLVRLSTVVVGRTDRDVRTAVAIDVARAGDALAETRTALVGLEPRRATLVAVGDSRGRAEKDEGGSLVGGARIVGRRPDDDVRKAVAVHVPRARDARSEARRELAAQ